MRKLFVRLGGLERPAPEVDPVGVLQNRVQWEIPSSTNDPTLLNTSNAEVVELADTPSARIALAILYKLLIIKLLPFTSITSIDSPQSGQ